jgi:mannose-6-phosphate isomerase-like protein (cupin superfamily)
MDKSPPPLSLAAALALPLPEGRRSAEVFVDGDLEIRLYAPKGHDPQTPHDRDELYIVAAGHGKFRVGDRVDSIRPGALLYVAAHEVHRFEDFSDDFAVWVVFYGPVKRQ